MTVEIEFYQQVALRTLLSAAAVALPDGSFHVAKLGVENVARSIPKEAGAHASNVKAANSCRKWLAFQAGLASVSHGNVQER